MAAEDFFARWAKPKSAADQAAHVAEAAPPLEQLVAPAVAPAPLAPPALPTMDDVAGLTRDSDYAPFMARGVDQLVQRGAMKKLFADPHFNLMDGLDIYIGDYNTADPIPAGMLALLDHAKGVLDPLSMFEKPVMQLVSPPKIDPESESDPELAAQPDAPPLDSSVDPLLDDQYPSMGPMLEPAPSGALNADADADAEIDVDIDADPKKPLPDNDEHTIQSL